MQYPGNKQNGIYPSLTDLLSAIKNELNLDIPQTGSKTYKNYQVKYIPVRNPSPQGNQSRSDQAPTVNNPNIYDPNSPVQNTPDPSGSSGTAKTDAKPVPFDEDRTDMIKYEKETDEEEDQFHKAAAAHRIQIKLTPQTARMGFIMSEVLGEPLSKKRRHSRWP